MTPPEIYVTNFNKRFTGVSSTAAAVLRAHQTRYSTQLVGHALPGTAPAISWRHALKQSRHRPTSRPFAIWHVRRNSEMQLAIFARNILRLPIRIVFTSAAQRLHSAWPRWLISKMDAVIATTQEAASFVPNTRLVVPHGVDTARFHPLAPPDEARTAWQTTGFGGDYGIVTVGRIRPEKGTDLFVRAMIEALPQLPGAQAVVIGAAKSEHQGFLDALKSDIAQAGLKDRFTFPGEIAAQDLPSVLRATRLLVALPRYEGYGMTPLEAMASGVPVVLSDTGHFAAFCGCDAPDAAPDTNSAGRLVACDDPKAAADAIVTLLTDPELHAQLASNARTRAVTRFSVQQEADAIARVYEELWRES